MAVQVRNVSKMFGATFAVRELSLTINQGEFFSLLGPSGCGKTTLLRMIAGFETPTTGSIDIAGKPMGAVPPHKRPVNMVFQSYALFPHMSVFDNIAFGLRAMRACPPESIRGKVMDALSLVRLAGYAERYPAQLSGGQQQRVALARAIVNNPTVLLLDEPLSALDLKIRQEMQYELERLQKELGITFIMVTHDQGEALALSDRIAVFYQGNLEQVGTPSQIYERPATSFVADFIGQTNFVDATVIDVTGEMVKVEVAHDFTLVAARNNLQLLPGQRVKLWTRTHRLHLVAAECLVGQDPMSVNTFAAIVKAKSYQGNATEYRIETLGGILLTALVSTTAEATFGEGQSVGVCLPVSAVQVLS